MRFLYIDEIIETEPGHRILAKKALTLDSEYYSEHYRRAPVMPATLVIEAVAQVAGRLIFVSLDRRARALVAMVEGVQLSRQVHPGEVLEIEAWLVFQHESGCTMRAEVRVEGEKVATVQRLVYAVQMVPEGGFSKRELEFYHYLGDRHQDTSEAEQPEP
jgi:3-hydroxyacyl-[acyl-carrier-protein] dehydratase